ncbi:hypothetical protein TOL_0613 [Thalassolituus oleivorans MIL-1]|uniref:Uncharacterized protein n=1 Tax=Thalassolituus oleivorans MIL-1 TaxID=1298593 RepID=M5DNQ6_9GAMM|nr:hypothetical protein TOL_0613 [Thalassolituus oleivorans MIL-1]
MFLQKYEVLEQFFRTVEQEVQTPWCVSILVLSQVAWSHSGVHILPKWGQSSGFQGQNCN